METVIRRGLLPLTALILLSGVEGCDSKAPEEGEGPIVTRLPIDRLPAWNGLLLSGGEDLTGWNLELGPDAHGSLTDHIPGIVGQAIRMEWALGTSLDSYAQARLDFDPPVNLSRKDLLGLSLRGSPGISNRISILLADTAGTFFGLDLDGINLVDHWMINIPLPFKMFYKFWGPNETLNWQKINRLFITVKHPWPTQGGGSGTLDIDHVQVTRAASWPRQTEFFTVSPRPRATRAALQYIISQQQSTGLFTSWKEEPSPKAHLYDQALVLLVLTRARRPGVADRLVKFLREHQKPDGHWARTWDPRTGEELSDDGWVGDQAWWIFALQHFANTFDRPTAAESARKGAAWLAAKVPPDGKVVASTEGNMDCWWALTVTGYTDEAAWIADHLLNVVWDPHLRYWWRGYGQYPDPFVALDVQTWGSVWAQASSINRPELGLAALSFARRALATRSGDGSVFGLDLMGPMTVWCEGVGQYVAAGGENAGAYLNMLLSLQRPDGSMPGATEEGDSSAFGWRTTWSGLSSTAWLYFALTGSPWKELLE